MFKEGDFIVHENNGVCVVEKIGTITTPGANCERLYYTLSPYYLKDSTIYTPVDNEKVFMRPVIEKEEAMELIWEIPNIDNLWIPDDKSREINYKEAIKTCDCRELVKIIKTIYLRKQSRIAEGKKITAIDEQYFQIAEDHLYGELAISLAMNKEEVKEYIISHVEGVSEPEG